ncbi:MAG: hypothetical protein IPI25_06165 [Candidatus Brocadia sp.]|nr:MAG: hypothetical protein IPI25_06165 [Candidatus Brocadia sp.]
MLAHVGEENRIVKEAMGKPNATESFKSSAQNFVNELDALAKKALLPFFNKYSSASLVNSPDFSKDLQGIKKPSQTGLHTKKAISTQNLKRLVIKTRW